MEGLLKKKLWLALLYIACSVAIEMLSFLVMGMGLFPVYWGIDLAYMLVMGLILFLLPCCIPSIVVSGLLLLLQIVISFVNEALCTMSGIVFSFTMLNLSKEVGGVFNSNFVNWFFLAAMLVMFALTLGASIVICVKIKTKKGQAGKTAAVMLAAVLLVSGGTLASYKGAIACFNEVKAEENTIDYNDDYYLYETQFISAKALRKFGFFGFYSVQTSNAFSQLFDGGEQKMDELLLADIDEYFSEGQMSNEAYGENIYTGSLRGKNLVLIVIESGEWFAINKEYTPTLYSMATQGLAFTEYYARDKTNHSEAMSILGSYPSNLPLFTDISDYLSGNVLPFTLPNALKKLGYTANYFHAHEKDFYDRDITHGTSEEDPYDRDETHGANGIYGFDTAHFLEDMPKLEGCNDKGESIKESFYAFDKDHLLMKEYANEYTYKKEGSDAFYTLHMTLSSHGHYEDLVEYGDYPNNLTGDMYKGMTQEQKEAYFSKNVILKGFEKYYRVIQGYPSTFVYDKEMDFTQINKLSKEEQKEVYLKYKRYQAGMMDLDEGVNSLLYDLNAKGELDDTTFFFYADHSAFYDTLNYKFKGIEEEQSWNSEVYNIPCFTWYGGSMNLGVSADDNFYDGYHDFSFTASKDLASPLKGGTTVSKFCNSFDLIPTILHLMGYNYNMNLYQGVSMLSTVPSSVFVSLESGIFTNKYFYDGTTVSAKQADGTWLHYDYEKQLESEEGLPEDILAFLEDSLEYYYRREFLNLIYKYDYFRYRKAYETFDFNGEKVAFLSK